MTLEICFLCYFEIKTDLKKKIYRSSKNLVWLYPVGFQFLMGGYFGPGTNWTLSKYCRQVKMTYVEERYSLSRFTLLMVNIVNTKVSMYSYPNNWRRHLLLLLTRIILPSTFWNQNSSKVLKILKCLEISTFFFQWKQISKRVLSEFTNILFEAIKILKEFRSEN